MKRFRILLPAAVVVAAMTTVLPSTTAQSAPLRSGTIASGLGGSQRGIGWPGQAVEGECQIVPDCLAWLESGCDPALAGREPAATASIVDVADLADGVTPRTIELSTLHGAGLRWGEVLVQFWGVSPGHMYPWFDCHEIEGTRYLTGYNWRTGGPRPIPAGAKWMTVTSNFDNQNVTWSLV